MDEPLQFILDAQSDRFTMAELCARYGVSRRMGYTWLARLADEGEAFRAVRSHSELIVKVPARSGGAATPCDGRAVGHRRRRRSPRWFGAQTVAEKRAGLGCPS